MTEPLPTVLDRDALQWILSTPQGRKTLWGILGAAGLFQQPFSPDPAITNFNCGKLNSGLILWADCLTVDPDLTAMMIREQGNVDNSSDLNPGESEPGSGPAPERSSSPDEPLGLGLDRLTGRRSGGDPTWNGWGSE